MGTRTPVVGLPDRRCPTPALKLWVARAGNRLRPAVCNKSFFRREKLWSPPKGVIRSCGTSVQDYAAENFISLIAALSTIAPPSRFTA